MPICTIVPDVFTAEECKEIIRLGEMQTTSQGNVKGEKQQAILNENLRKSKLAWFGPDNNDNQWIHQRLNQHMEKANTENWNFLLDGKKEHAQFTIYEKGGFYNWHIDVGDGELTTRKLSAVVQLNHPAEYQSGGLELFFCGSPKEVPKGLGTMVIFPSYVLHRVIPVQDGIRYSLVQWWNGKSSFV